MRELVLELMGEYGNLAVFLLILVENLFPPIPSEVILTFGGVMTVCTDMTPVGVILFSTAGSLAGAVILYSLISIPAGIARMPFVPFLVFTAAGSLLWNTVLVYAGRIAGDSWEKVSAAFGVYSDLFLMIAGISIAFAVLFRGCGERRKL